MSSFCKVLVVALGGAAASNAFAVGAGEFLVGVRTGDFQVAPQEMTLALTEASFVLHSDPLLALPEVTAGLRVAYDEMRGSLGGALSTYAGFQGGPEVTVGHRFAYGIKPFATLGYRVGRFTGKGSENWSGSTQPALYLYGDSAAEKTKTFQTSGTHAALGLGWEAKANLSMIGEFDFGYEAMDSDTAVVYDTSTVDRRHTRFNSRSLQFGAQLSI